VSRCKNYAQTLAATGKWATKKGRRAVAVHQAPRCRAGTCLRGAEAAPSWCHCRTILVPSRHCGTNGAVGHQFGASNSNHVRTWLLKSISSLLANSASCREPCRYRLIPLRNERLHRNVSHADSCLCCDTSLDPWCDSTFHLCYVVQ
jgi:hypothetical protein